MLKTTLRFWSTGCCLQDNRSSMYVQYTRQSKTKFCMHYKCMAGQEEGADAAMASLQSRLVPNKETVMHIECKMQQYRPVLLQILTCLQEWDKIIPETLSPSLLSPKIFIKAALYASSTWRNTTFFNLAVKWWANKVKKAISCTSIHPAISEMKDNLVGCNQWWEI